MQAASCVEEVLAAADLLVLPGEETIHWQTQPTHVRRRQCAAGRALVRLARWLAPIAMEKSRARCVADPRFARIVAAVAYAAHPEAEDEGDEEGEEEDAEDALDPEVTVEALRALGSLGPLPRPPPEVASSNDAGGSLGGRHPHRLLADAAARLAASVASRPGQGRARGARDNREKVERRRRRTRPPACACESERRRPSALTSSTR